MIRFKMYYCLCMIVYLSACQQEDNSLSINNLRIRRAVEKKKEVYATQILEVCRRDILTRADLYVDSLITAEINFQLSDSIVFPPKPGKPLWPGPIIISDTIRARPINR